MLEQKESVLRILVILFSVLSTLACANDSKMPRELPAPINEEILIYSVAQDWEIGSDRSYTNVKKENLEKISAGYVLSKGKVNASSNIINLINSSFGETNAIAMCFDPRHTVKYESKYGTVEVNICFECGKSYVTIDGWGRYFYHTKGVKDQINKLYIAAGLSLPVDH
jgi:hypothetical protein